MHRNQSVDTSRFAMVPRADVPRSAFRMQTTHKTTFDSDMLVPIFVDELLPGDSFNIDMTAFVRMTTPIVPIMDNVFLDSFFFFVPNRLVWNNWQKFMGEQIDPGDSIDYLIPQLEFPGGIAPCTLYDYMGIPNSGQLNAAFSVSALPFRAYNLIWNEWFRDENIQDSITVDKDDGPDAPADYTIRVRGKRKDYFTGALPWPQKGTAPNLGALFGNVPITSTGLQVQMRGGTGAMTNIQPASTSAGANITASSATNASTMNFGAAGTTIQSLQANLGANTSATVNAIRQMFQIQKLLERDARGGTRYTEIVRSHFGVISPDARLQRPEYIGGGSSPIGVSPIAQTGPSGTEGSSTPLGTLGAMAQGLARHGCKYSATEHGHIIGLISIRADLTYQQGIRRMFSRRTRYDYYFPAFAHLGEQAILRKEIYATGNSTDDNTVFGYQERWGEMRYHPSKITGFFNSRATGTLDIWHLAQNFLTPPILNESFIQTNVPIPRISAINDVQGQQFLCDTFFNIKAARPLPTYSVPGLVDHF